MAIGIMIADRFYWNLDYRVGPGGANKIDDVQLVQLAYVCLSDSKSPDVPADLKALASKIDPRDSYSGRPDENLTTLIRLHQKYRGGTQDGVISPIHNPSGRYTSTMTWMMMALDQNIFDKLGGDWPHIDKHFECPSELKQVAMTAFKPLGN